MFSTNPLLILIVSLARVICMIHDFSLLFRNFSPGLHAVSRLWEEQRIRHEATLVSESLLAPRLKTQFTPHLSAYTMSGFLNIPLPCHLIHFFAIPPYSICRP
jgi:hypothetical protein